MSDRRNRVDFDPDHFAHRGEAGPADPIARFRAAYRERLWGGEESGSGPGASHAQTARLVELLPSLLRRLSARSLLDIPCGDFHWMRHVDLWGVEYTGADLLPELIDANQQAFAAANRRFVALDLTRDPLPRADVVLCRDCLVHLSFADIDDALQNIRQSGARYLLTTTFPAEPSNIDVITGDWRPLDLEKGPFDLGAPLQILNEGCTEQDGAFSDKSLGVWAVETISTGRATRG